MTTLLVLKNTMSNQKSPLHTVSDGLTNLKSWVKYRKPWFRGRIYIYVFIFAIEPNL